jgi:CubicO group peptidase (beta-lactamase class C family)
MPAESGFSRRVLLAGMAAVVAGGVAACSDSTGTRAPTTGSSPGTTIPPAPESAYFPPTTGEWATSTAAEAGLTEAGLAAVIDLVGGAKSQSLVILHEGRIVAEHYWRGAAADTTRDIASCQKSVTSTLIGLARDKGLLALDDPVSHYLSAGWTNASAAEEAAITIRHLLTMTSGLNPNTLKVVAAPGTVWRYNTEAYQKLRRVLEAAAGTDINTLSQQWLFAAIGLVNPAAWAPRPGGPVSSDAVGDTLWGLDLTAREMARYGLFAMRNGEWAGDRITAQGWFAEAWTPTPQKADYGYLWWLIGRGHLGAKGAPADLVAALGAQDQKIYVVPSLGLVLSRQGGAASDVTAAESDFDAALLLALAEARA